MNFTTIKEEYETTKNSFRKLADRHKTHYKKIERMAKKEGWIKFNPSKAINPPTKQSQLFQNTEIDTKSIEIHIKELFGNYYMSIDSYTLIDSFIDSYSRYKKYQAILKNEDEFIMSKKGGAYMNPKYIIYNIEQKKMNEALKNIQKAVEHRKKHPIEEKNNEPTIFDLIKDVLAEE